MVRTHEGYQKQKRKGKDVPYLTHPLTVALILSRVHAIEDVIIAGILHDTIEDSIDEKKVSREMIESRFGTAVADLVESVTEQDKTLPWEERKEEALQHIATFSHDSMLLKSADVIANNAELLEDYAKEGEKTFERFNAPKEKSIPYTCRVIDALLVVWPENPLGEDLQAISAALQKVLST